MEFSRNEDGITIFTDDFLTLLFLEARVISDAKIFTNFVAVCFGGSNEEEY